LILTHFNIVIEQGYDNLVYRSSIFADFFISEYKCSRILTKNQQKVAERLQNKNKGQPLNGAKQRCAYV